VKKIFDKYKENLKIVPYNNQENIKVTRLREISWIINLLLPINLNQTNLRQINVNTNIIGHVKT